MTALQESAQVQLRRHIDTIERLEEQKREIADEIKDEFAAAKATGFDPKIMRKVLAIRRKDKHEVEEEAAILATYLHAMQMSFDFDEREVEPA